MRYDDRDQHQEYANQKNLESYDIEQKLKDKNNIMNDAVKKGLEYIKTSNGEITKEVFFDDMSKGMWVYLVEKNYVEEDEYGLVFLTPMGYEALGMKIVHYKDEKGFLKTNCPYGTYAHSRPMIPKVGSGICEQCKFFEYNNTEKNYVVCCIEMEKNKVEIGKIRDRILDVNVSISGTSSTSGLSGTSGYSGRSGYGHIRGDATSGEWVVEQPDYIILNDRGER